MSTYDLKLTKVVKAPREKVFAALVEKGQLEKWFAPVDMTTEARVFEPKEGGAFEVAMKSADGSEHVTGGVFKEVDAPNKIVMTWKWLSPEPGPESLLTFEFNEVDEGTEVVLTHENFADEQSRDMHQEGWTSVLEKLAVAVV